MGHSVDAYFKCCCVAVFLCGFATSTVVAACDFVLTSQRVSKPFSFLSSCTAFFHSSLLDILSGLCICTILGRHLLIKTCELLNVLCVGLRCIKYELESLGQQKEIKFCIPAMGDTCTHCDPTGGGVRLRCEPERQVLDSFRYCRQGRINHCAGCTMGGPRCQWPPINNCQNFTTLF